MTHCCDDGEDRFDITGHLKQPPKPKLRARDRSGVLSEADVTRFEQEKARRQKLLEEWRR